MLALLALGQLAVLGPARTARIADSARRGNEDCLSAPRAAL
jgi:hypothetical protein